MRPAVLLPAVVALGDAGAAGLTWAGWEYAGRSGESAALAVLLVATPLGLMLAQRLPVRVARHLGRGVGITHVGAGALAAAPRLDLLVLDTARTVTTGNLVVTDVRPLDPTHENNLRWFAGALAHRAHDPVSRAIARLSGNGRTHGFTEEPDRGILGSVDRHPVRVGRTDWLGMADADGCGTTVGVEVDHRPLGHITVADEVRPDAPHQLARLRRSGVRPVLVSAAAEADLARVAGLAGAEEWYADTDTAAVVDRLADSPAAPARVGWATLRAADPGERTGVELVLPGEPGEDTSVRSSDSSVASIVASLGLLRRTYRARTVAVRAAWVGVAVLAPPAAAGLLPPAVAGALAVAVLLVVALVAVVGVTTSRSGAEG